MSREPSSSQRTVLITGCSDGGLGAALAIAFHEAGLYVYATARNVSKMADLSSRGIATLRLDVESPSSIADCVAALPGRLDILVNNAGSQYLMPVVDIDVAAAKRIFDINVWAHISVTKAFLPLLLAARDNSLGFKPMVVNQTSSAAVATIPFQSVYNASKAAMAMMSDTLRLELQPFSIAVVDLRTALVKSNLIQNMQSAKKPTLPVGSIYDPARERVERAMSQKDFETQGMPAAPWAELVVADLMRASPPPVVWRGEQAWLLRLATVLPFGMLDGTIKKITGLDVVEKIIGKK